MRSFLLSLVLFALLSTIMGLLITRARRRGGHRCGHGSCRCEQEQGHPVEACCGGKNHKE